MKKVLVTGAAGQLGKELQLTAPDRLSCHFVERSGLDITNADAVQDFLSEHNFDVVINAAAYTAVDKAEENEAQALEVNAKGPENLVKALGSDQYLIHISTDFVFDGLANRPYPENSETHPASAYGRSKLEGEKRLAGSQYENWSIVRTSWVYSSYGANFVKTMLRFMDEREALNIVVDQVGSPTWAKGLAKLCWSMVDAQPKGIFHWSDAGAISWFDFAHEIQRLGLELGLLKQGARLNAIPTEGYPLPAPRPAYSVLDKSKILAAFPGLENTHWQENLQSMLQELIRIS